MPLPELPFRDPVAVFALLAVLLLVVPLLARKLRIPAMVGLILAGAAVGPRGTGLLESSAGLDLLARAGLLYIMFVAGLEIDLQQFRKQRGQAVFYGLLIFGFAMVGGAVISNFIFCPAPDHGLLFALLMGALMASQTLLTYPVVSRLGLAKHAVVAVTAGATVLTDVLALVVLAVVAHLKGGEIRPEYWLRLGVGLCLFAVIVVHLLPRLGRWFYRNHAGSDTTDYLFLFASLLFAALMAKGAGLEPIVGAFLAGLALNPLVPEQSRLMNRVQFIGSALFIPVFLISVGMLMDVRVFITGWRGWGTIGLMLAVAVGAKFLASWIAGRMGGRSRDQWLLMFGMVVNKAGVTLATAAIGFQIGLFDQNVFNGAIVLLLATCLLGPWITESCGRRVALQLAADAVQKGAAPPQRILVPLANPATAGVLMDIAFLVRDRKSGQPLFPISVVLDGPDAQADIAHMEKTLSQAVVHALAADVPVQPETRVDADVAAGLARAARELRANTMIIGWNGGAALPRVVFGRVLDRVLAQTAGLVLVCKIGQPVNTFQRLVLVVPPLTPRLSGFEDAVQAAGNLAAQAGAGLLVAAAGRDLAEVMPAVSFSARGRGRAAPERLELDSWSGLWRTLETAIRENDLVLLLSCRSGSLAWQPGLDRLPRRFIRQFPQTSLIVAYPAESAPDAAAVAAGESAAAPAVLLQPERTLFLGSGRVEAHEGVERLVEHYLQSVDGDSEGVSEKAWVLAEALLESGLEITPGTLLLHVHCDNLEEPVVLLGISGAGMTFPDVAAPVHAVLLLLSPNDRPPEEHLRMLSEIARLVMAAPHPDRIRQARTLADLRAALPAAPPPPEGETGGATAG